MQLFRNDTKTMPKDEQLLAGGSFLSHPNKIWLSAPRITNAHTNKRRDKNRGRLFFSMLEEHSAKQSGGLMLIEAHPPNPYPAWHPSAWAKVMAELGLCSAASHSTACTREPSVQVPVEPIFLSAPLGMGGSCPAPGAQPGTQDPWQLLPAASLCWLQLLGHDGTWVMANHAGGCKGGAEPCCKGLGVAAGYEPALCPQSPKVNGSWVQQSSTASRARKEICLSALSCETSYVSS